jgi:hypothetical protein
MTTADRVLERRRAAALARHYRDEEGLSIAEIARRLGRADATIKAYLYDPSHATNRPTDSPQKRQFWALAGSCTDVDLQAAPWLSLRRHEAGVPLLPDLSEGSCPGEAGEAAALVLATQEFVASRVGRRSGRRRQSAASPGRTGSRGGVRRRGWWRPLQNSSSGRSLRVRLLLLGDNGRRPNSLLLLAEGPSSTRQLAPDPLAVGACKHPMFLVGSGHWPVRLLGRSSPCEASAQGQPNRSAGPNGMSWRLLRYALLPRGAPDRSWRP